MYILLFLTLPIIRLRFTVLVIFPAMLEALHAYVPISFSVVLNIDKVLLRPHLVITQSPSSELIINNLCVAPELTFAKTVSFLSHSTSG